MQITSHTRKWGRKNTRCFNRKKESATTRIIIKGVSLYLDSGLPVDARGEKDTSNSSSIAVIVSTKYLNLLWKIPIAWLRTSAKLAWPCAIRFSCCSTAARMVGFTRSTSIYNINSHAWLALTLSTSIYNTNSHARLALTLSTSIYNTNSHARLALTLSTSIYNINSHAWLALTLSTSIYNINSHARLALTLSTSIYNINSHAWSASPGQHQSTTSIVMHGWL